MNKEQLIPPEKTRLAAALLATLSTLTYCVSNSTQKIEAWCLCNCFLEFFLYYNRGDRGVTATRLVAWRLRSLSNATTGKELDFYYFNDL